MRTYTIGISYRFPCNNLNHIAIIKSNKKLIYDCFLSHFLWWYLELFQFLETPLECPFTSDYNSWGGLSILRGSRRKSSGQIEETLGQCRYKVNKTGTRGGSICSGQILQSDIKKLLWGIPWERIFLLRPNLFARPQYFSW